MKKFKILVPLTCTIGLTSIVAPILSSCGCTNNDKYNKVIPTDLLQITDNTLKGFKKDADVSSYDTLTIPNGIRIVGDYAFEKANTNIKKIIIPSSVKEIGDYAFYGLLGLKEIDLTSLDTLNAHYIKINSCAFGVNNFAKYVNIKLNSNLTSVAAKSLKSKLMAAGIPSSWFVAPTTGHIEYKTNKENTNDGVTPLECNATLTNIPDTNAKIEILLQKTGGTNGIGVALESSTINQTYGTNITFKAAMDVMEGHKLANGDNVIYDAIFICKDPVNTVWVQTVENLKLTYEGNGVIAASAITLDISDRVLEKGEEFTLIPTVYPASCTDKSVKWKSSKPEVATVDQKGKVTGVAAGTTIITATTANGLTAECEITIEEQFNPSIITTGFDEELDGYVAYIKSDDAEAAAKVEELTFPETYNDGYHGEKPIKCISRIYYEGDEVYTNLKSVVIPDSVEIIYDNTFAGISTLEQIKFGADSQLKEIGARAFYRCTGLKLETFELPETLVRVGYKAFQFCRNLWSDFYNDKEDDGKVKTRYVKDKNDKNIILFYAAQKGELEIDQNCRVIADSIWATGSFPTGDITLNTLKDTNIKGIGARAFWPSDDVAGILEDAINVVTPSTLKYIAPGAFRQNKLSKVTLNEGLEFIDNGAFAEAIIGEINIPDSVTKIGRKTWNIVNQHADEIGTLIGEIFKETKKEVPDSILVGTFECSGIDKLIIDEKNSKLEYLGTNAFLKTYITQILQDDTFVLPKNIKELCPGSLAFSFSKNIVKSSSENTSGVSFKMNIPSSVIKMQTIFYGWSMIEDESYLIPIEYFNSLNFPDNLTWRLYQLVLEDSQAVLEDGSVVDASLSITDHEILDKYQPNAESHVKNIQMLNNTWAGDDKNNDGELEDIYGSDIIWEKNVE